MGILVFLFTYSMYRDGQKSCPRLRDSASGHGASSRNLHRTHFFGQLCTVSDPERINAINDRNPIYARMLHIRSSAKEWVLGCVNSPPAAMTWDHAT